MMRLLVILLVQIAFAEGELNSKALQGKVIYDHKCSQCHGESGDGQGVGAHVFRPLPRDFTLGVYKFRSTPTGELPTHEDLMRSIRQGMPYTGMPAWPNFSEGEVEALATYIESFSEDFADTSEHPESIEISKPPSFKIENVKEGRQLFEANKCFDCHGQNGFGDGESAPTLSDDWGNPIRPADLTKPWAFRGGPKRQDIYRAISTGLNGTPMPSFANDISPEDRWKLVDYIQSLSPSFENSPYGLTVVATQVLKAEIQSPDSVFSQATPTLFPIIGQVIENPRCYAPGVNALSVQAIYDSLHIVFQLKWHNMSADTIGKNTPNSDEMDTTAKLTDAVSLQFPAKPMDGKALPYFLMGDKKNSVDFWFGDLSSDRPRAVQSWLGKGSNALTKKDSSFPMTAAFKNGEWTVRILKSRVNQDGLSFTEGEFIPIAFSVWDGSLGEAGNKRGITAWYSLFLKPQTGESPWLPAGKMGGLAFMVQFLLLFALRWSYQTKDRRAGQNDK